MAKVKNGNFFQAQVKEIKTNADDSNIPEGVIRIRGFASTPSEDRGGDIVEPSAFKKALKKYMNNPQILLMHDPYETIGLATSAEITDKGIVIEADLSPDGSAKIDVALTRVKQGKLRTLSIGYIPLITRYVNKKTGEEISQEVYDDINEWGKWNDYKRRIIELDLVENSVVSTPMNADAIFTVEKSLSKYYEAIAEQEKALYNINTKAMPKPKKQENNANPELENEIKTMEEALEKKRLALKELEEKEDNNDDADDNADDVDDSDDSDDKENKDDEGKDDDNSDDSDDSDDDDAEKSDENSDAEDKGDGEKNDADKSDDGEADDADAENKEEDAEEDDGEKNVELNGAIGFIKSLGNFIVNAESDSKKVVKIDLKKLVDVKDIKALSELCEKLLGLSISQQKELSDLKDKTPNRKVVKTLMQYPHTKDVVKANADDVKKEKRINAIKGIFKGAGYKLKD